MIKMVKKMNHSEYIRISKDKDTAVVLIHGILGTPRFFDDMLSCIPKNYSIYNILLDGHGGSFSDFTHTSKKKWINQVENLVSSLEKEYNSIILVGHSMGTLLSMEIYKRHTEKIKKLVLFACPLKIFLKPISAINTFKTIFGKSDNKNPVLVASSKTHGVPFPKNLFKYLLWLPRYKDLFSLSKEGRKNISFLKTKCYTFFSAKDEMVSINSMKYFKKNPCCINFVLKDSWHYYYSKKDFLFIKEKLTEILL